MTAITHASGIPVERMIIRLPEEWNSMGHPQEVTKGHWNGEEARMVVKSRPVHNSSREIVEMARSGAAMESCRSWTKDVHFTIAWCGEHRVFELVPSINYYEDLSIWYFLGRHPKFSALDALMSVGQGWHESAGIFRAIRHGDLANDSTTAKTAKEALLTTETKEEFLKKVDPFLSCNLYIRGRRYRVTKTFKEKYKRKDFTIDDFFREWNQEVRRTMLRVLPIKEIVARMKLVAADEEGSLHEYDLDGGTIRRYLYVICPSTKQEYLLEVPREIVLEESHRNDDGSWHTRKTRPLNSPKEARRWTFNLPADAQFKQEA